MFCARRSLLVLASIGFPLGPLPDVRMLTSLDRPFFAPTEVWLLGASLILPPAVPPPASGTLLRRDERSRPRRGRRVPEPDPSAESSRIAAGRSGSGVPVPVPGSALRDRPGGAFRERLARGLRRPAGDRR